MQIDTSKPERTQMEAKALGDETRFGLFFYISRANRPVFIDELTIFAKVNHNAVRQHLEILKNAGLVLEQPEVRTRPGRPRLQYVINPDSAGTWKSEGPYQKISKLLLDTIKSETTPRKAGRSEGSRRAQEILNSNPEADAFDALNSDLLMGGFKPETESVGPQRRIVLKSCPFREVAAMDPKTICQIHLGLLEGLGKTLDPRIKIGLTPEDPYTANCLVSIISA